MERCKKVAPDSSVAAAAACLLRRCSAQPSRRFRTGAAPGREPGGASAGGLRRATAVAGVLLMPATEEGVGRQRPPSIILHTRPEAEDRFAALSATAAASMSMRSCSAPLANAARSVPTLRGPAKNPHGAGGDAAGVPARGAPLAYWEPSHNYGGIVEHTEGHTSPGTLS